jgi:biopolymer transport protein ExbD
MRFPHNAKIFRGQFDAAPYVGVFFLLVIFLLAHSAMVFVPGVPIELPVGADLPGIEKPIAVVAVDAGGTFYFENQRCDEKRLRERLKATVERSREPITLVTRIDRAAATEAFTKLAMIAQDVGILHLLHQVQLPAQSTAARPANTTP